MYVCSSLRSEARGLQRLLFLKYFYALEWESRFTLERNATKNTSDINKCFKQKVFRIKFPTKNKVNAYLYLPQECN